MLPSHPVDPVPSSLLGLAHSGRRLHYSTLFHPGTVGAVSGEVVRVEHAFSGNGADYCVQALLTTPKGQVTAILAPRGYMEDKGLAIAPKDRVTIIGSFLSVPGKSHILTMEVWGNRNMKLREINGRPAWASGDEWHVRTPSRSPVSPRPPPETLRASLPVRLLPGRHPGEPRGPAGNAGKRDGAPAAAPPASRRAGTEGLSLEVHAQTSRPRNAA